MSDSGFANWLYLMSCASVAVFVVWWLLPAVRRLPEIEQCLISPQQFRKSKRARLRRLFKNGKGKPF